MPFPQAVPSSYIIDIANCLGTNPIACGKCADVCEKDCIDYDAVDELIDIEVGSVIVATGMEPYDPTEMDEYGYTRFENVITSMEFERLICAGGPTEGHFIRPSDRKHPRNVAFIQCVGSRSLNRGVPYCSNICCMNTVKDTLLLHDHYPDLQSKVFYMDIRAFGKGFEDLYRRSRAAGVQYIRGLPGAIAEDPLSRNLQLMVENTLTGQLEKHEVDMVVLAVGLVPRKDSALIRQMLTLSPTSDGFVMEAHPKLKPVDAPTKGVYLAGCVEAPKDIKDSVTQASAAVARSNILLNAGEVKIEAITSIIKEELCNYCNRCARVCPFHAITTANKKAGVYPHVIEAACSGCGTCAAECTTDAIIMRHFEDAQYYAQIDAILSDKPMEKIVAFACNWCSYAGGDNAGTSRLQYPANVRLIRTMCSGRVDEDFVLYAFRQGAPLVLISGCHFSDCHYINAVTWTQQRVEKLWDKLEKTGVRPERLQLEWISAAEGVKFARVMKELEALRQKVTPEEVAFTKQALSNGKQVGARTPARKPAVQAV
jgi:heterodisulfide reductase subunit A